MLTVLNHLKARLQRSHQWGRSFWRSVDALPLRFLLGLLTSLIVVGIGSIDVLHPASGIGPSPASAQASVLRIGHQKFDPLTLVKARGNLEARLKPLGVTSIQWIEFPSGPPMLEALNAGSIDIARTGDAPPVIAQAAGIPLVYVGGSAPKDRSSALLVRQDSPIRTVADLKGKRVALAKSSSANYLIVKILESAGLKWRDIQPAYLAPADARAAFERGSVDAWVVWDPFYAAAQVQAGARVLRNSSGLVTNRDFYLSTRSFADKNANVINAIRLETERVAAWAEKNPNQVVDVLSPLLRIDRAILNTVTRRRNYGFEPITPVMITEQQAIASTFYRLKLIPKPIKIADAVHPVALARAR